MDNNIWIRNTFYIAEKNNIKISDIENYCEISTGYLNKLRKSENPAKPSIETVERLAKRLSLSIDSFVGIDLTKMTKNDEMIMNFIKKLEKDTLENGLNWIPETVKSMEDNYDMNDDSCGYPLMELENVSGNNNPYDIDNKYYVPLFKSRFNPDLDVNVHKLAYKFNIDDQKYVWLYNIYFGDWIDREKYVYSDNYEMYIIENGWNVVSNVCNSGTDLFHNEFYDALNSLYNSIKLSKSHSIIDDNTKLIIRDYLNKDKSSNEEK